MTLTPFRVAPWFRTRPWGTRELASWYEYRVEGEPIGEVWLTGDRCLIETGSHAGTELGELARKHASELLGAKFAQADQFPLLMKVLFPKEKLSVQVHPDDELAQKYGEPRGKTECWYVLEAAPEAAIALGLKPGTTTEHVKEAITTQTLEEKMQWLPVVPGEMFFVAAGTVHAIGPGSVLLETQQQSDLTYRLYDYGSGRELHLERGLEAVRLTTDAGKVAARRESAVEILVESHFFRVERMVLGPGGKHHGGSGSAQILFAANGSGVVRGEGFEPVALRRGQVVVVPAACAGWELHTDAGMEVVCAIP
jgi:mannose-6-phosphate isomerase